MEKSDLHKVEAETAEIAEIYSPKKIWNAATEFFSNIIRAPENEYDIIEPIGEGAYASVYLARKSSCKSEDSPVYAIKSVNIVGGYNGSNKEKNLKERLSVCSNEVEHLQQLKSSPYVVQIFGVGLSHQRQPSPEVWIVTEYCETGDIGTLMDECNFTFTPKQVKAVLACSMLGLKTMHDASLVHRDIKPYNIFVTKSGIAKIGDLGTAAVANVEHEVTGTLTYVAPELLYCNRIITKKNGRGRRMEKLEPILQYDKKRNAMMHNYRYEKVFHNHKVDIWAIGMTSLHLILGKTPFYYLENTVDILKHMKKMHGSYKLTRKARRSNTAILKYGSHFAFEGDSALPDMFHTAYIICKEAGCEANFTESYRQPMEKVIGRRFQGNETEANRKFIETMYEMCHDDVVAFCSRNGFKNGPFLDFLRICLMKHHAMRPSTPELLKHAFLDVAVKELQVLERVKVVQPTPEKRSIAKKTTSVVKTMFRKGGFGPVAGYVPNPKSPAVNPRRNTLEQLVPLFERRSTPNANSLESLSKTLDPLDPFEQFL